jgi:hypothetical protein
MEIIGEVNVAEVQQHEANTDANVRLVRYRLDACCPTHEFRCHRIRLDPSDDELLYVLCDFARYTKDQSSRLRDVTPEAASLERVASFMHGDGNRGSVDLRSAAELDLLIVSKELKPAPLVIYDGCHRAIAQFLRFGSLSGVPAYVCVHPAINSWAHVPPQARRP